MLNTTAFVRKRGDVYEYEFINNGIKTVVYGGVGRHSLFKRLHKMFSEVVDLEHDHRPKIKRKNPRQQSKTTEHFTNIKLLGMKNGRLIYG